MPRHLCHYRPSTEFTPPLISKSLLLPIHKMATKSIYAIDAHWYLGRPRAALLPYFTRQTLTLREPIEDDCRQRLIQRLSGASLTFIIQHAPPPTIITPAFISLAFRNLSSHSLPDAMRGRFRIHYVLYYYHPSAATKTENGLPVSQFVPRDGHRRMRVDDIVLMAYARNTMPHTFIIRLTTPRAMNAFYFIKRHNIIQYIINLLESSERMTISLRLTMELA